MLVVYQQRLSDVDGVNVKQYNHFGEVGRISIDRNMHLTNDPAVLLVGIYTRGTKTCM